MDAPSAALPNPPRRQWRSLGDLSGAAVALGGGDEFPANASEWPGDLDRRGFLRLMGSSLALGGLGGCMRATEKIVPYVTPPEDALPGVAKFYASAIAVEGFARGILVESNLGRPTKIEGNPDHPESLGATDAPTQASILSLYDPDRSRIPTRAGRPSSWDAFEAEWNGRRAALAAGHGRGLALLTEPTTSPSVLREIHALLDALPQARWYQHTPLARHDLGQTQQDYTFSQARVLFSVGSDFLFRHPASLRYAREFSRGRRREEGSASPSRFYALESTPTVTGAMADVRLPASPSRIAAVLEALGDAGQVRLAGLSPQESGFVRRLARDLRASAPQVACIAGPEQPEWVQLRVAALNATLGAVGRTTARIRAWRSDGDPRASGDAASLVEAAEEGSVETLLILGPNPAYTSVAFRGLGGRLPKVPFSVHLGGYPDETAALCTWHLPEAHFLESWGDLRSFTGVATIQQPLIEPMFEGRSLLEVLRFVRDGRREAGYALVRETWGRGVPASDFESQWFTWVRRGIVDEKAEPWDAPGLAEAAPPHPAVAGPAAPLWLLLEPDASVLDGRGSNNAWMQELPRPMTHLVWDNALLVSPALAARMNLAGGDLVRVTSADASLEAAVWLMPGQAGDCVTLALGYGRTAAGSVGSGLGFDAYRLRPSDSSWAVPGIEISRTGSRYALVTTQHHFAMEGRDPVHTVGAQDLGESPAGDPPSLYKPWGRGEYAWGMSIDLSTCLGCNACVVACQAENNIPVVGKDQVARGREMQWMRIDRYFEGGPDNPRMLSQPVPCMHCENAPCELVCPVAATVHSSEGLNQMVYNRCVGTRYCSNNCPYKVRRFNFLDYRSKADSPVNLQKNPDVTVRERGVMEKCTYCVQRINAARITAEKEDRPIRDGEIRTACQQACPVEAIVFGNVADPASRVSARKRERTSYGLLAELNTRPRTTYLAKMTNPGEDLQ